MIEPSAAEAIRVAIKQLFEAGQVVEVRVPKTGALKRTISGYFDDFAVLEREIIKLDKRNCAGIYYTLNPVTPALLARANNRLREGTDLTTKDPEILRRCWLPIDVDPTRAAGISSTNGEKALAQTVRMAVYQHVRVAGWPEPLLADSGNGYHLLYRIDLPNDDFSRDLLARCLKALAARFDQPGVKIDTGVFNASRIVKAYGSMARKGDNTQDRPWRRSQLLTNNIGTPPGVVSLEALEALAAEAPVETERTAQGPARRSSEGKPDTEWMEKFLEFYGLAHDEPVAHQGGTKWRLAECIFNPEHRDAAVFTSVDGKGYHCFHESCKDEHWSDTRAELEKRTGKKFSFTQSAGNAKTTATPANVAVAAPAEFTTVKPPAYPVFPHWVMEGTSLYEGLVKPACEKNSKYAEFIFISAATHLLNFVALRVRVQGHTFIPSLYQILIGAKGVTHKSSSVELAMNYCFRAEMGRYWCKGLKAEDLYSAYYFGDLDSGQAPDGSTVVFSELPSFGRSLIVTAGSPEGFAQRMCELSCFNGILYYDEFWKLAEKAGIEHSVMIPDLNTMYESGQLVNVVRDRRGREQSTALLPGTYCVSMVACCPTDRFQQLIGRLTAQSSGFIDRCMFILEPEKPKLQTPLVDFDMSPGVELTKWRVKAAIDRRFFAAGDWTPFAEAIGHLGVRPEIRAEKFALYFAIDLGRDSLDDDCKRRGIALAEYDLATKAWLSPIEAYTRQGQIQQEILLALERAGGAMPYRDLQRTLHAPRLGTDIWNKAVKGLQESGRMRIAWGDRKTTRTMAYMFSGEE